MVKRREGPRFDQHRQLLHPPPRHYEGTPIIAAKSTAFNSPMDRHGFVQLVGDPDDDAVLDVHIKIGVGLPVDHKVLQERATRQAADMGEWVGG